MGRPSTSSPARAPRRGPLELHLRGQPDLIPFIDDRLGSALSETTTESFEELILGITDHLVIGRPVTGGHIPHLAVPACLTEER